MTDICPDCARAEREPWPVYTSTSPCCWARSVAETVGRSGAGYTRAMVQAALVARITGRASADEAQAFMRRLDELGVSVE